MSTEFNSNLNFGAIQKKTTLKPTEIKEENLEQLLEDTANETISQSFPVGQSAIAGKSQIKTDNISNDLLTLRTNPNLIKLADQAFDRAFKIFSEQKDPEAYEKACLIANAFVQECIGK